MSEETEGQDTGAEAVAGGVAGADPAAVAFALTGADRSEANAYLREQRALVANQSALVTDQRKMVQLQAKELSHELKLRHWSLWVRHASGLLKLALEVALAVAAAALACFLAAAVWNAAHADGLVIDSFSVPPDLAQRGLTGEVIAGEILDRLTEINQATVTARTGKSYAASWGDEIKVEIPDTGVSVAEAYRFLRRWLGHESHISGAVWHNQSGIVITAHTEDKSVTITGPESDLDGTIRKAAEGLFGLAEPYRYGAYLTTHGRNAEGIAVWRQLIANGSAADRAWGLTGLARSLANEGDIGAREQERLNRQAVLLDPSNSVALYNLAASERAASSHLEDSARDLRKLRELLGQGDGRDFGVMRPQVVQEMVANQARVLTGAYGEAVPSIANLIRSGTGGTFSGLSTNLTLAEIGAHDLKAARATALDWDRRFLSADAVELNAIRISAELAIADQNWPAVVAAVASADPLLKRHAALRERFLLNIAPLQAYAEARLGRFSAAETMIAATPPDCDECMLQRAWIVELRGQHARADWWFARAVQDAPSIPLVYSTWGEALLLRGDADGAIAKFKTANQKGPHFADPLEMWGEALMAKNQSHLALAKFSEAEKYAPNWGRLHMKWGEALMYAGKRDEAKAQFARAAQLDLTLSEKSELAQVAHG